MITKAHRDLVKRMNKNVMKPLVNDLFFELMASRMPCSTALTISQR